MTDNKLSKSEDEAFHVDLQEANTHRRTLESEVKIRTSAMETYEDMNSSLIAANISLQVTDSVSSFRFCGENLQEYAGKSHLNPQKC